MKGVKSILYGSLLLLSASACAETLIWWRFGEAAPGDAFGTQPLVNMANPGTYDGRAYCVGGSDWSVSTTEIYAPHGIAAFPSGVVVYDPVSGVEYVNDRAMTLNGLESGDVWTSGAVKCTDASVFKRQTFTAEVFVRMTVAKANLIAGKPSSIANVTHPIFSVSKGLGNEIWGLFYYKGQLGCRMVIDGWKIVTSWPTMLNDGQWHHVAFVADGSNGSSVKIRTYMDYRFFYETECAGQFDYVDAADFNLGVDPFSSTRKFPGDIDEFRFSDAALSPSQFLRFDDQRYSFGFPCEQQLVSWEPAENWPTNYWFGDEYMSSRGRAYHDPKGTFWSRGNYAFGGSPGMGRGAYVDLCVQTNVWSHAYGISVTNRGSFRTINQEVVTMEDQQQGGYFILTPPPSDTAPLTGGDFTIEYFYKSNGGNKLGAGTNATILMYPTDENNGEYKTPDPVIQHFFTSVGTSYLKFKNQISGTVVEQQYDFGQGLDSQWHHFAIAYSRSDIKLSVYVDRNRVLEQADVELPSTSQGIVFGSRGKMWNNNNSFDGWIDEVRITKRALSEDELMQLERSWMGMRMIIR